MHGGSCAPLDLDTGEPIRILAKAAAESEDDRIQQLVDTAPRREYTATDLDYLNGIKKIGAVSLQARYELQKLPQVITQHEPTRAEYMALMLLNESLSRLSRGSFEIDEFGVLVYSHFRGLSGTSSTIPPEGGAVCRF